MNENDASQSSEIPPGFPFRPQYNSSFDVLCNGLWSVNGSSGDAQFNISCGNSSGADLFGEILDKDNNYWSLLLSVFPLLTVFGNVLVVLGVYKERSLRTVTNYFIVSLAVADIMVALLVMPLAVYVELRNTEWDLGDGLCDTWVALDVMCCTASILNLVAISVDRFLAVTQPIRYATYKTSKRAYVMLGLTWVISIAISSPIALGMNYTERRAENPTLCVFYNSDFLIYSSMGSFYIPCIVMVLLYWRIFHAIRQRARKAAQMKNMTPRASSNPVPATAKFTDPAKNGSRPPNRPRGHITTGSDDACSGTDDCNRVLLPKRTSSLAPPGGHEGRLSVVKETSFNSGSSVFTGDDDQKGSDKYSSGAPSSEQRGSGAVKPDRQLHLPLNSDYTTSNSPGYISPTTVVVETTSNNCRNSGSNNCRPPMRGQCEENNGVAAKRSDPNRKGSSHHKKANHDLSVTKFKFLKGGKQVKGKKDKNGGDKRGSRSAQSSAQRAEKKATKTLAIVLGVFLICWVPFFTLNILNAVCIRYNLFDSWSICTIDESLFSLFVWGGYMNSFLNPVIYTIFNIEFRRAFKKLLCPQLN